MPTAADADTTHLPKSILEREIVLSRVFAFPRELVFRAWTDPEALPKWFGPRGFNCTTQEIDIRVGDRWRFEMRAPDGTVYPNHMVFLELESPSSSRWITGATPTIRAASA